MSRESGNDLVDKEKFRVPEQPKEAKTLAEKLRGKLLVAAALGAEAFLAACGGLRREDIEAMPTADIEKVIESPEEFSKFPILKVKGYPISTGRKKETYIIPSFKTDPDTGKIKIDGFSSQVYEVDTYDIHSTSDLRSSSIKARSSGVAVYGKYGGLDLTPNAIAPHEHQVAGKLEKVGKGDKTHFVLDIKGVVDQESPPSK